MTFLTSCKTNSLALELYGRVLTNRRWRNSAPAINSTAKLIAVLGLLVTSTLNSYFANASDFELITDSPDSHVYIDRSSVDWGRVKKKLGDKRQVRTLVSYKTAQRNYKGETFNSMSFLDIYSCADRTLMTLSAIEYEGKSGTGRVVFSHKMGVFLLVSIRPGTVNELILAEANCNLISGKWGK